MKKKIRAIAAGVVLAAGLAACSSMPPPSFRYGDGTRLYTTHTFFYENGSYRTTNYHKGVIVPVNTEVEVLDADSEVIVIRPVGSSQAIEIINVSDYSGETIDGIYRRMFSPTPVDLSSLDEHERELVRQGRVAVGMTKPTVLAALGYPPKHKTPSLEADAWRYWRNRFDKFVVRFENGRVSAVEE